MITVRGVGRELIGVNNVKLCFLILLCFTAILRNLKEIDKGNNLYIVIKADDFEKTIDEGVWFK